MTICPAFSREHSLAKGQTICYTFFIRSLIGKGESRVAESTMTKRVLAATFKKLVRTQPFEKVNVSDICDGCGVSRKTFYYHFQDKYELAEWIFNTEFIAALKETDTSDQWAFASALCGYFYREREYYANLVQYSGQNSFRQYFQSFMFESLEPFFLPKSVPLTALTDPERMHQEEARDFFLHFFTDAVLISIFRWLTGGTKLPPDQFVERLQSAADILLIRVKEDQYSN